jgi:tyrosyl-tRNA synthetase
MIQQSGRDAIDRYNNKQTALDAIEIEKLNRECLAPNDPRRHEPYLSEEERNAIMARKSSTWSEAIKGLFNPKKKDKNNDLPKDIKSLIASMSPAARELFLQQLEEDKRRRNE